MNNIVYKLFSVVNVPPHCPRPPMFQNILFIIKILNILETVSKNVDLTVYEIYELDICGFVHYSIIHIENPTKYHNVSKFYFIFI
jgi:hypothetical protein